MEVRPGAPEDAEDKMEMRMLVIITVPLLFFISNWSVCVLGREINQLKRNGPEINGETSHNIKSVCNVSNKGRKAKCQGCGETLTEIPSLPSNITYITITGFTVSNLTETFFLNVEDLNIRSLNLSNNSIQTITKNAFKNLKTVQTLDLSFNNFTSFILKEALPSLTNSSILTLFLKGMSWIALEPEMLQGLAMTNITEVSLSQNLLSIFNGSEFSNLTTLKSLDLSENVIYFLDLRGLSNLTIFNLQENDISRSYIFCKAYPESSSNIEILNLTGNHLRFVKRETFECMKQLKVLVLDNNPITTLVNGMLAGMTSITELHLSHLCHINRIEDTAFKSRSLKKLYFRDNGFRFNETSNLMQIFQHFSQLETLDISNNYLKPPLNMSKIFSNLHSLVTLNLGKTRLYVMPENVFMHMQNLSTLLLSANRFASWDGPKVFGRKSTIKELHLSGNYITVVNQTSFPESLLVSLQVLDLSNNHFSCTCENLWFRGWIRDNIRDKKDNISLPGYKTYMCKSPKKMSDAGVHFIDYNPTEESCAEEKIWMYPVVAVAALIVFTVTIATLLYKCRWNIRYKIYLMKRHKYTRIPNDEEFVYVGYVIYSDNDREWVHDVLRKRLEDDEGLRLCVRLRDFEPGNSIVDNIGENMHLSRKLVIVISNNFAKDDWCRFELNLAQHRRVSGDNDLILVMLNEVNSDNLSESLHVLITTMPYAIWSNEQTGETLFWEQVIEQLN